jgi:hypothetical protein
VSWWLCSEQRNSLAQTALMVEVTEQTGSRCLVIIINDHVSCKLEVGISSMVI